MKTLYLTYQLIVPMRNWSSQKNANHSKNISSSFLLQGNVPRTLAAFPRWVAMLIDWNRKLVDLFSPVLSAILVLKS